LLNYDFTKGFPAALTHTRASGATVVDESGNVVWADENLISDSGNLDALLVLIGTPTPVPVVGGPSNEYHILRVNGGTGYRLYRKGLSNGTASGVHVILAKQGTARYLGFGSGDTYFNQFDWDTMTWNYNSSGCTGLAAVAHPEGDGWFYIALFIEYNGLNGISYLDINCSDATDSNFSLVSAVGTETVLVADTMRARKMAAPASFAHSDFFVTTGSTAYHAPRITHDSDGNALGYLHEPQVTNKWKFHRPLLTFTGINIQDPVATGSTLVEAASESNPSGGQGASLWTPADFSSRFYHYGISGAEQTMSAWIKAPSGAETFKFSSYNTTDSSDSSSVLAATGEWKRFQFTVTTTANGSFYIRDTSGPLLIWGFQVEEGTVATSLIPTFGAEATRQADAVDDLALSESLSEGTIIVDVAVEPNHPSTILNAGIVRLDGATNNDFVVILARTAKVDKLTAYTSKNGVGVTAPEPDTFAPDGVTFNKIGLSWRVGLNAFAIDGTAYLMDNDSTNPDSVDTLVMSNIPSAINGVFIYRSLKVSKYPASESSLQNRTT
tara:strand:- start:303 stop:1964 length:1662 start_codon:yes stop_codon:yes gene_type:complete